MDLSILKNKDILLVGYGREARSVLSFLERQGIECRVAIADKNELREVPEGTRTFIGGNYLQKLPFFDFVFKSPGVPNSELQEYFIQYPNSVLTSGTAIFLDKHRGKVIGVSGTKGKSTTSSLLAHVMKTAGYKVILAGNIGLPALEVYEEEVDYFVLEMSSYQLEDVIVSPAKSIFLNIYEEHLDYHKSFDSYLKAKSNIAKYQKEGDVIILPRGNRLITDALENSLGKKIFYGPKEDYFIDDINIYYRAESEDVIVCKISELTIKGAKNVENVLACLTLLNEFQIPLETIRRALVSFKPLLHRLEEVGVFGGVLYVNDSIATVPEAAMSAIDVYSKSLDTIILGGFDRGLDFAKLAEKVLSTDVSNVILFLPSGLRIRQALEDSPQFLAKKISFFEVGSMDEAILVAGENTKKGKTCLLSPASPSFTLFKNFEERGDKFREGVMKIEVHPL